jgi:hypothetical protein
MAQFRVEFVLDQASGKYLAEMYHPESEGELLVRTEALYPTQAAAVLGVVQLFKNAILKFPEPTKAPRIKKAKKAKKKASTAQKAKKAKKAKKPKRKQSSKRRR